MRNSEQRWILRTSGAQKIRSHCSGNSYCLEWFCILKFLVKSEDCSRVMASLGSWREILQSAIQNHKHLKHSQHLQLVFFPSPQTSMWSIGTLQYPSKVFGSILGKPVCAMIAVAVQREAPDLQGLKTLQSVGLAQADTELLLFLVQLYLLPSFAECFLLKMVCAGDCESWWQASQ